MSTKRSEIITRPHVIKQQLICLKQNTFTVSTAMWHILFMKLSKALSIESWGNLSYIDCKTSFSSQMLFMLMVLAEIYDSAPKWHSIHVHPTESGQRSLEAIIPRWKVGTVGNDKVLCRRCRVNKSAVLLSKWNPLEEVPCSLPTVNTKFSIYSDTFWYEGQEKEFFHEK